MMYGGVCILMLAMVAPLQGMHNFRHIFSVHGPVAAVLSSSKQVLFSRALASTPVPRIVSSSAHNLVRNSWSFQPTSALLSTIASPVMPSVNRDDATKTSEALIPSLDIANILERNDRYITQSPHASGVAVDSGYNKAIEEVMRAHPQARAEIMRRLIGYANYRLFDACDGARLSWSHIAQHCIDHYDEAGILTDSMLQLLATKPYGVYNGRYTEAIAELAPVIKQMLQKQPDRTVDFWQAITTNPLLIEAVQLKDALVEARYPNLINAPSGADVSAAHQYFVHTMHEKLQNKAALDTCDLYAAIRAGSTELLDALLTEFPEREHEVMRSVIIENHHCGGYGNIVLAEWIAQRIPTQPQAVQAFLPEVIGIISQYSVKSGSHRDAAQVLGFWIERSPQLYALVTDALIQATQRNPTAPLIHYIQMRFPGAQAAARQFLPHLLALVVSCEDKSLVVESAALLSDLMMDSNLRYEIAHQLMAAADTNAEFLPEFAKGFQVAGYVALNWPVGSPEEHFFQKVEFFKSLQRGPLYVHDTALLQELYAAYPAYQKLIVHQIVESPYCDNPDLYALVANELVTTSEGVLKCIPRFIAHINAIHFHKRSHGLRESTRVAQIIGHWMQNEHLSMYVAQELLSKQAEDATFAAKFAFVYEGPTQIAHFAADSPEAAFFKEIEELRERMKNVSV